MRCLVIGCGSIGSRRARILQEMGHDVWAYDSEPARVNALYAAGDCTIPSYGPNYWLADGKGYDAAFVCTPPDTHIRIVRAALLAMIPTFVEKPLSLSMDGIPELIEATKKAGLVTMGACNLRFAYDVPDLPTQMVATVWKPLSEWRPGAEAYRANGLVLECAIHELDLVYSLHGPIRAITALGDEDHTCLVVTHESGDESHVYASWQEGKPTIRNIHGGGYVYEPDLSDEMYRREMAHFLDCVERGVETCNPLRNAAHVLEWALKAQAQLRAGVPA